MRKLVAFGIMAALLCSARAYGLTMKEAVDLALRNNHRIKQFGYIEDSAGEGVGAARAGFLPSLDFSYSYTEHEKQMALGGKRTSRFGAEASYNLFNGLSDYKGLKGAKSDASAAAYNASAETADVVLDVKSAYIDVLKAERQVETALEGVDLLGRQRDDAELYYREGLTAKNDLLKVEVELASARQELLQAERNRSVALKRLERLMAVEIAEDEEIADFEEMPAVGDLTFEALKEEMLGRRSELRYLRAVGESHRLSAGAIMGGYLPRVDLVLSYDKNKDSGTLTGIDISTEDSRATVSATWNVFDGLGRRYRASQERYMARSIEEQLRDTEGELVFQLKEALEDYRVSLGKLDVAGTAVLQAEENYRVTENQYRERAATTTDLLDARTFLTRARNQRNESLYDVHLAASRVERVLERGGVE